MNQNEGLYLNPVSEEEIDTSITPPPVIKPKKGSKKPKVAVENQDRYYPELTLDELFHKINASAYSGKTGCLSGLSDIAFKKALSIMQQQLFESERLAAARQLISSSCLLSIQLGKLLELTEFDDSRHALILLARGHIFDLENLPSLADKFTLNAQREKFLKNLNDD